MPLPPHHISVMISISGNEFGGVYSIGEVVAAVAAEVRGYGGCMDSYVADATVSKIESFFVYEGCRVKL